MDFLDLFAGIGGFRMGLDLWTFLIYLLALVVLEWD